MTVEAYDAIKASFNLITKIFFREVRTSGTHNIPEGPSILIVAPHANQFIDPGMVLISSPIKFSPLMAQTSFKRKLIGTVARWLKSIPVVRPQDLATKGSGTVYYIEGDDQSIIKGKGTRFTQEVGQRDMIALSKTVQLTVEKVISDTEIKLKSPLDDEARQLLSSSSSNDNNSEDGLTFKVIPHVDQGQLYEKVHERLNQGGSIVIFPEGGSHDRSELLPLKAGFAIMALSAMAENENLSVNIIPVGLNYFHPHRFRSRAVVSYGNPIKIDKELVEKYKQGGAAKREAIATVLNDGYDGLKAVTTNAPDYDTLMILAAARRLYKPAATHKLRIDQVVDLNRRFLLGYKYFKDDPQYKELENKVKAYNNQLKYFGISDHQVERTKTTLLSAAPILINRLVRLFFLAVLGFPALIANVPLLILARVITIKKQKEALAGSSVKIAARDVLATWKVIVALVFTPILYGFYSSILFIYLWRFGQYGLKSSFWWSVGSFVLQPFFSYLGVRLVETGFELINSLQPLIVALSQPDAATSLREMREKLSDDITNFVNENGPTVLDDFDPHKFDHMELKKKAAESWKWNGVFKSKKTEIIQQWFDDSSLFNFSSSTNKEYIPNSSDEE